MDTDIEKNNWHTIVIGGGQAGLATGYYLKKQSTDFLILDAGEQTGDSWRNRWNSLRLFTPAWNNGLPGLLFPGDQNAFPTKEEVADYLLGYKEKFRLPVCYHSPVTGMKKTALGFQIRSGNRMLEAENVVIATGNYSIPKIPSFAGDLHAGIRQLHSADYNSPDQLPDGKILVVGAGTSGFQIATDLLHKKRNVYIAGNPTPRIPEFVFKYFARQFMWMNRHILNTGTPMGRKFQATVRQGHGAPLIHISPEAAEEAGITMLPRLKGVQAGRPVTESGKILDPAAIVWCTGFNRDYSWLDLPDSIGANGYPDADRGVSLKYPGLYFVGTLFQYALTSTLIGGVGRDAEYIARHIRVNRKVKFHRFKKSPA